MPDDEAVFRHYEFGYIAATAQLMQYGILPRAGGLEDQDPLWWDEVQLYLRLRARAVWEQRNNKRRGDDIVNELFGDGGADDAPAWNEIMRG